MAILETVSGRRDVLVVRALLCVAVLSAGSPPLHPVHAQAAPDALGRAAASITSASLAERVAALSADSLWGRTTPSAALDRTAQYLVTAFKDSATVALQQRSAELQQQVAAISAKTPADTTALRAVWAEFQKLAPALERISEPQVRLYVTPGRRVRLNAKQSSLNVAYSVRGRTQPVATETGAASIREFQVPFARDAYFAVPRVPELNNRLKFSPSVAVLTGRPTAAFLRQADVANKTVIYLPPADWAAQDSVVRRALLDTLYDATLGTVVLERGDSARFAVVQAQRVRQPLELVDVYLQDGEDDSDTPRPWVIAARSPVMAELLDQLGIDLAQADTARAPAVHSLSDLHVYHTHIFDTTATTATTAPVVAQFLEGTDSVLQKQCLVLVAPLDQREWSGSPMPGSVADSLARRADPSTVSLAGLLELARAFRTDGARPRRSILFLATSGGAPGQLLWGSHGYLYELWNHRFCNSILSVTIDLGVGLSATAGHRPSGATSSRDTAVIAGLDEVKVVPPPAWVAAAHPELGLTVANGGTVAVPRSDAYAFNRRGYPSLLMQGGPGPDRVQGASAAGALDLTLATRLLRLAFFIGAAVLEAPDPPQSTATGRRRLLSP